MYSAYLCWLAVLVLEMVGEPDDRVGMVRSCELRESNADQKYRQHVMILNWTFNEYVL